MANVDEKVEKISKAIYGKEVRKAICDAITAMNDESTIAYSRAVTAQDSAKAYADSAKDSADDAEAQVALAQAEVLNAKSYAVGGTGTREGEDQDNAKYYMEQAQAVAHVNIATTTKAGIVKPDGTSITVEEDGTIHAVGATKPTTESITLLASNWQGESAPYTYDMGIADTYDAEVLLPNTATADVVEAVTDAQMCGNGSDNIIRAWGEKPSIDIPVIVRKAVK